MKKYLGTVLAVFAFAFCAALVGCTDVRETPVRFCRVVIESGYGYTCEDPVIDTERGSDVTFSLSFDADTKFTGTDYRSYEYEQSEVSENGKYTVTLTLKHVMYSSFVRIVTEENVCAVITGEHFKCENNVADITDGIARFDLIFDEGYTMGTADHDGTYEYSAVTFQGRDRVTLELRDVSGFTFVEITAVGKEETFVVPQDRIAVNYSANGGTYGESAVRTSVYLYSRYRRSNTSAVIPEREGFVMKGWNTRSDGNGEHVGVGSRIDAVGGQSLTLYAEWKQSTEGASFTYISADPNNLADACGGNTSEEYSGSDAVAVITSYKGYDGELVIPSELGGMPVAGLAADAVAYNHTVRSAFLPDTVLYVAEKAFLYCSALCEITLYDNIEYFSPMAFAGTNVLTLNINASLPPAYIDEETAQFANKTELLLTRGDKPLLVLYGGCAVLYGADACAVTDALDGYDVINMGVIGGTCSVFQMDIIRGLLNDGDVLVHLPEAASEFQMFANIAFDSRAFINVEANYDLLAALDMTDYGNVWAAFSEYLTAKRLLMSTEDFIAYSYDYDSGMLDERGCLTGYREGGFVNDGSPYMSLNQSDMLNTGAAVRMKAAYTEFADSGIRVLFGWSPIDGEGLNYFRLLDLESYVKLILEEQPLCAEIFMSAKDAVMDNEFFYDTTYHLSTEGAAVYSAILADRLDKAL